MLKICRCGSIEANNIHVVISGRSIEHWKFSLRSALCEHRKRNNVGPHNDFTMCIKSKDIIRQIQGILDPTARIIQISSKEQYRKNSTYLKQKDMVQTTTVDIPLYLLSSLYMLAHYVL